MLSLAKVNGKAGKFDRKATLATSAKTKNAFAKLASLIRLGNFVKVGDAAISLCNSGTIDERDISAKDWNLFGVEFA